MLISLIIKSLRTIGLYCIVIVLGVYYASPFQITKDQCGPTPPGRHVNWQVSSCVASAVPKHGALYHRFI
jgi:hypothetical protein